MKAIKWMLFVLVWMSLHQVQAQTASDSAVTEKKYQAKAPKTQPFGAEAFKPSNKTTLRWLGMAGFLLTAVALPSWLTRY